MIGDWVKIDNRAWNVRVLKISEDFNILYTENTGRTLAPGAPLTLDPLGTFIGHKVTFARMRGHETEFDQLFDYLMQPRYLGIPVEIVHGQTTLSYTAYVSSGSRELQQIDEKTRTVKWDKLSVSFIPVEAQVTP